MKYTIEIDVTNCNNCIFKAFNKEQGFSFYFCKHTKSPKGYDSIINDLNIKPVWCPLIDLKKEL